MTEPHTLRVRGSRWEVIEKIAWKLSLQKQKPVKPTDVADAAIWKGLEDIKLEDVENAKISLKKLNKTG